MLRGPFVGTGLHTELNILGFSLHREWGLHKYSGVSCSMGFTCTTEEVYFCKIAAYIKAHMGLYCFWHPGALFTRFCQPCFLSEQRPHTTIGWTILQNLSGGLSWGWARMRSIRLCLAWGAGAHVSQTASFPNLVWRKIWARGSTTQVGGLNESFHSWCILALTQPLYIPPNEMKCSWMNSPNPPLFSWEKLKSYELSSAFPISKR